MAKDKIRSEKIKKIILDIWNNHKPNDQIAIL